MESRRVPFERETPVRRLVLLSASLIALAVPPAALAHGIHGKVDGSSSPPAFVWLGIRHMVGGWDHLLFIAGIVLLAGGAFTAAKLISLFVAGHSTTLLMATVAGWQLNATAVDIVIALSVAYIGLRVIRGRPARWTWTGAAIFGFGLVHGLGLSTRLQELDLPGGGALVARVLAFNLGVEIGQLLALSAVVVVGLFVARRLRRPAEARPLAARGLVGFGLLGAVALAVVALATEDHVYAGQGPECVREPAVLRHGLSGGRHPERPFYAPEDRPPRERDLQHVLRDGFVVVRYRPELEDGAQDALEDWAREGPGVVAVPDRDLLSGEVRAETWARALGCAAVDLDQLSAFRDAWREERRRQATGEAS